MADRPPEQPAPMGRYIPELTDNQKRWARLLGVVVLVVLLVWLARAIYGVLTLLVVSFAVAYILNPIVQWGQRLGMSRLMTAVVVYAIGLVVVGLGSVFLVVAAQIQITRLAESLPTYVERMEMWLSSYVPTNATTETDAADAAPTTVQSQALLWLRDRGVLTLNYASNVFDTAMYYLTASLLIPVFSFFFLLEYDPMLRAIRGVLPARTRDTVVHIFTLIDAKTAEFFRGRLLICALVGLLTGIGWAIVGVPYSLPFGVAVAVLNLVPFLTLALLPPALLATYSHQPENWVIAVSLAFAVYIVVQGLESFVLQPLASGGVDGLHPVTTIVSLLIGAELAGLLGMLLCIPVASTLKTLLSTYVMPEVRRLARAGPTAETPDERASEPEV